MENWRQSTLYDTVEVSDLGQIRRKSTGRILVQHTNPRTGYTFCLIPFKHNGRYCLTVRTARLIAREFIGPCPKGLQINHKNLDKRDNAASNLEYVTQSQNILHSHRLHGVPKHHKVTKVLSPAEYTRAFELARDGTSQVEIGRILGVTNGAVSKLLRGKTKPRAFVPSQRKIPVTVPRSVWDNRQWLAEMLNSGHGVQFISRCCKGASRWTILSRLREYGLRDGGDTCS
jgi:hypothetical protein